MNSLWKWSKTTTTKYSQCKYFITLYFGACVVDVQKPTGFIASCQHSTRVFASLTLHLKLSPHYRLQKMPYSCTRIFRIAINQQNLYNRLAIVCLSLLIAFNIFKTLFIQSNEKIYSSNNLPVVKKVVAANVIDKGLSSNNASPPNESPLEITKLTESEMEEELTRRRRQILEICQAKGFKDSDIPVHEDSEKPSLYHYTALNLFMCM